MESTSRAGGLVVVNYEGGSAISFLTGKEIEFSKGALQISTSTSLSYLQNAIKESGRVVIHESTEPMKNPDTLRYLRNLGTTIRFIANSWKETGYYVLESNPYFLHRFDLLNGKDVNSSVSAP